MHMPKVPMSSNAPDGTHRTRPLSGRAGATL
jgi:hypothetical protein